MRRDGALSETLPAAASEHLCMLDLDALHPAFSTRKPRILILYGSLREISYSRLLAHEARRLLERFGCEVQVFDPKGLPLPDEAPISHPKVKELRDLSEWSEGQVWVSPERHGAMTGIMKAQIDWIPLSSAPFDRLRARRWRSWKCPAAASRSMRSTRCAFSVAGCG